MQIVYQGGVGEITEKKSRFIATVQAVSSEQEALDFIAAKKKEYWDARHNCYAYIIGQKDQIVRCSDDGEPAQTAGRPMLDILQKSDVYNVVVVVTRYFGGVLLGTGGLVRAYQQATIEGLKASVLLEVRQGYPLTIQTDYNSYGKLEYLFRELDIVIEESEFGADVCMYVTIDATQREFIEKEIADKTAGMAKLSWAEVAPFGRVRGKIVHF